MAKKLNKTVGLVGVMLLALSVGCRSKQEALRQPAEEDQKQAAGTTSAAAPAPPPIIVKEAKFVAAGKTRKFDHTGAAHKEVRCEQCHVRDDQSPAKVGVDFPGHSACSGCHVKEDFGQRGAGTIAANPFCGVCHDEQVATASQDQSVKAVLIGFPDRQDEFGLKGGRKGFSHKTHMDRTKMAKQEQSAECATCHHQMDATRVRADFPGHKECYGCHIHQAGQKSGDCGTCHIGSKMAVSYSPGMGQALTLYRFSHSKAHLKAASCDKCHAMRDAPENPTRVDIAQISTNRGLRHKSMCWTCHKAEKEVTCTKCHTGTLPF